MARTREEITGRVSTKAQQKRSDPKYATRHVDVQRATTPTKNPVVTQSSIPGISTESEGYRMALDQFNGEFLGGAEALGYLKICPAERDADAFFYFKFTYGAWAKHYVVVLGPANDSSYCLGLLAGKIRLVLSGSMKPTLDKYLG